MKLNAWRVDWPNHIIGFFSALFGILIAFELDEWREAKNNQEEARNALDKIKQEIQINKGALHEAVKTNLHYLELLELELLPYVDDKLEYKGLSKEAKEINSKIHTIARINLTDTLSLITKSTITINMGKLLHPTIHYSAWESAKATGVINYIEYEKVLTISYLYNIPRVTEELQEIRMLIRKSDEIISKSDFEKLLIELKESHNLIKVELVNYDIFVNIIEME